MKLKLSVWVLFTLISAGLFAQDEEGFSDEDLKKYAGVMVWAEMETQKMADSVEVWVKNNENLSASAYNKLSKASKSGTIDEVEATEDELADFQGIQAKIENQKKEFKAVYVDKIKEDIGAGLYNRLKKALKSDEEVKSRYDAVYSQLKNEMMGQAEESSQASESGEG